MAALVGRAFWFKSSHFEAEPGEDEETNPRRYGRQVAQWLHDEFRALGYDVEGVFGDDWGWRVDCQRDPYDLFIGCANLLDYEYAKPGDPPPPPERLLWNVGPMATVPFFRSLFRNKPDLRPAIEKMESQLEQILERDRRVEIVDDEVANTWFQDLGLKSNLG